MVSGLTTYAQTGDIKQALISGAVGAATGAIAATGWHFLLQAGASALASFAGDIVSQTIGEGHKLKDVDCGRAINSAIVAGGCSIIGSGLGKLTSYGKASQGAELMSKGRDKLLTGYIRRELGQSASSMIRQGQKLVTSGRVLINTARGISSVTGTILTWGVSEKYSVK